MVLKSNFFMNKYLLHDYSNYLILQPKLTIKRYIILFSLLIYHVLLRRKQYLYNLSSNFSKIVKRDDLDLLEIKFNKYDVISFDIFDTLIFRPFEKPTDLFYLLQAENENIYFWNYRIRAEIEARKENNEKNGEINIYDIYRKLGTYYKLDKFEREAEKEIDLETKVSYANPYMYELYKKLLKSGKEIIVTSDMYIPKFYMKKILDSCGYDEIKAENIFVSCDYGFSKESGKIQEIIQNKLGKDKKVIHIDDNLSCIKGCKKSSWDTFYYQRCNSIKDPAVLLPNTVASSVYNGIVHNYLLCGKYKLKPLEELGFYYAGIAVCGYNDWITDFCKKNNCDKILFLARDMDIFYKVYNKYYNEISHEYIQSSRNALRQLYFPQCKEEFFDFVIRARANLGITVHELLKDADLLLLEKYLPYGSVSKDDLFCKENQELIVRLILNHVDEIQTYYEQSDEIVKKYFKEKIGTATKICIAGLGWAGTEIVFLKWLFQKKWKFNIKIEGVLFGSYNDFRSYNFFNRNKITCFAFDNKNNIDLCFDRTKKPEVAYLVLEHIFSSSSPSLIKFDKTDEGIVKFILNENNQNAEYVNEIQNGIMCFVEEYMNHGNEVRKIFKISGRDAYIPLFSLINDLELVKDLMGMFVEKKNSISGFDNGMNNYVKLKDIF